MRYIRKLAEPFGLRIRKQRQTQDSPQNLNYANLPTEIKDTIKTKLLEEQGFLCAYTLRRLDRVTDCHIEHILPQNVLPEEDLDYRNMAACFPKDGGDTSHNYGAPIKGGTSITLNKDFVSPHHSSCERRFRYDGKGGIAAVAGDVAAENTVALLKLNHNTLQDLRRSAIETHGLSLRVGSRRTTRKLKSAAEARRFAKEVLETDDSGHLEPYCIALAQVALEYAEKEEARSHRLRDQRGS